MIVDSDDLLTELLLRLPAKSLIRFKLVCKRWLSLISSLHFCHLHTTRHRLSEQEPSLLLLCLPRTPHHYYLQTQSTHAKLVPYHFPSAFENPTVCSFSNGLFLLQCPSAAQQDCHVYNPATKQSRRISVYTNETYPIVVGLNIVFDPLKSPRYKIICVRFARRRISGFFMNRSRRYQIEMYESDTSTWQLCGDPFFAPSCLDFNRGIYWNNGIHWNGIFLDLDNQSVGEHPRILVPEGNGLTTFDVNYADWNGSLYCAAHYPRKKLVAVFELQSDYSQWSLKYKIDFDPDLGPLSVLSLVWGYSEEDTALLIHKPGKIMAYGFAEKSFKELMDFNEEMFYQKKCVQSLSPFTCQFFTTLTPV